LFAAWDAFLMAAAGFEFLRAPKRNRVLEKPVVFSGWVDSVAPMTQDSRQALIELLFLSLYLDAHLSLTEDDVLTTAMDSLGWESAKPREQFILSAFALAREASACELQSETFMQSRIEIIKAAGVGAEAYTWLNRVLGADGITASEQRFLSRLEARFFP
jgi:hypothetical protein